jgi:hypothetical protein
MTDARRIDRNTPKKHMAFVSTMGRRRRSATELEHRKRKPHNKVKAEQTLTPNSKKRKRTDVGDGGGLVTIQRVTYIHRSCEMKFPSADALLFLHSQRCTHPHSVSRECPPQLKLGAGEERLKNGTG